MKETELPFELFFVGGAPRTGTSLLHSIICSSDNVNNYIRECSYFRLMFESFMMAKYNLREHNASYFNSENDFFVYNVNLLKKILCDFWSHLGSPPKLVLKDPLLTPNFHLLSNVIPEAKFIITFRNALDVVASRKKVAWKIAGSKEINFDEVTLKQLCDEYNKSFLVLRELQKLQKSNHLIINYEDFRHDDVIRLLESFLDIKINLANLWSGDDYYKSGNENEWCTDKYLSKSVDVEVGTYKGILDDNEIEFVISNTYKLISSNITKCSL